MHSTRRSSTVNKNSRKDFRNNPSITYMKLSTFRKIVKQHESGWFNIANNMIWGENEEISRLKLFLKRFEHYPDDYEFTLQESFQLLWMSRSNSNTTIFQQLKYEIHNFLGPDQIKLIEILDDYRLLDEDYFIKILLYRHNKENVIKLIMRLIDNEIILNQDILDAILLLCENTYTLNENTIRAFMLLVKNQIYSEQVVVLLKSHEYKTTLLQVIQYLIEFNLLTSSNLIEISKSDGFIYIEEILYILSKEKILIDDNILMNIYCANQDVIQSIARLAKLLFELTLFNQENFILLLNLEKKQVSSLSFALTYFQSTENLSHLDQNILNWMILVLEGNASSLDAFFLLETLLKDDDNIYYDFIRLINMGLLLTQSHLNAIRNFSKEKVKAISDFIQDITRNGLMLNVTIIDWVLSGKIDFENDDASKNIVAAIDILFKYQLLDSNLSLLTQLKSNKLSQISSFIINLHHYQLLTQENLDEIYRSVTAKLPSANPSTVTVESKKLTGESRSSLSLSDGSKIYLENTHDNNGRKEIHEGAFGEVKRGYSELTSDQPLYAIKKPKNNNLFFQIGFNASPELQCKRELKYGRLLNRNAFYFFHNNKPRAVMDWLNGILLKDLTVEQAREIPIKNRLQLLISALSDLSKLHEHYRSHNDIKSDNLILNFDNQTLQLIDFGISGRPTGERTNHYFFDIGNMGHCVLPLLFPDILKNESKNHSMHDDKQTDILKIAITILYQSMIQEDPRLRCHCSDALHYCHEILKYSYELKSEVLNEIVSHTIHRNEKNVEDVLHEYVTSENKRATCLMM